jgi:protein phosphatase
VKRDAMNSPSPTPAAEHLKWFGWTDRGKVRPNNEDAFVGLQFDARDVHRLGRYGEAPFGKADLAFAVSDGMGGALAGEFASRTAVEKITTLLPRAFQPSVTPSEIRGQEVLTELFNQIHHALTKLGDSYPECKGMETTLSLCWLTPGRMFFAHIGDSRIYYLPAGENGIQQLSHDDTHVGWLRRTGKLNEREARAHPRRNVLQRALGGDHQFVAPQVGALTYRAGDIFLLCTDGLVGGLYDNHLVEVLRAPESRGADADPARVLVEESLQKDGHDNATALVIQIF